MTLRAKTVRRALPALAAAALFATAGQAGAQENAIKGDPQAAKAKISMCIGCHGIPGYKASFPEVIHVPLIAGQRAEYIQAALQEYASGARSFPTMQVIAQNLTPQEMADVAAYFSQLKK